MPDNADAHGLLALALIRAGWQEPYADEAKKSLALDPQNYWGLLAFGPRGGLGRQNRRRAGAVPQGFGASARTARRLG